MAATSPRHAIILAQRDEDGRGFGYTTVPDHWDAILFVYQHGGRIVDSEQRENTNGRMVFILDVDVSKRL